MRYLHTMVYIPPLTPWGRARQKAAHRLYQACMTESRNPVFYQDYGVPDTLDGRFDLLSLFVALVMNRLKAEGRDGAKLSQSLFDEMFLNVELSCREMGIGDLSVPRHMKRMMAAFNGRLMAYGEHEVGDALRRNLFGTCESVNETHVMQMKNFIESAKQNLAAQSFDDLKTGQINFIKDNNDNDIRKAI